MADETGPNVDAIAEQDDAVEMRPCCYCGTDIFPGSYRCPSCGGVVALGWGTVLKEHFIFLFASILIAVGCVTSWSQRFPPDAMIETTIMVENVAAPGEAPLPATAPKFVEKTTKSAPVAVPLNGLETIRGSFMFCLALYAIIAALFNIFFRRMIVWPFIVNGVLALEVGLTTINKCMGSAGWEVWVKHSDSNFVEKAFGRWRAVPASQLLLTFAGAIVLISIIKGIVGGFAAGAAMKKEKQAAADEAAEARRSARGGQPKDSGRPDVQTTGTPGAETPKS